MPVSRHKNNKSRGKLKTRRQQQVAVKNKAGKITRVELHADAPLKHQSSAKGTPGRVSLSTRARTRRAVQRLRRPLLVSGVVTPTKKRQSKRQAKRELLAQAALETKGRVTSMKAVRKYMRDLDRRAKEALA